MPKRIAHSIPFVFCRCWGMRYEMVDRRPILCPGINIEPNSESANHANSQCDCYRQSEVIVLPGEVETRIATNDAWQISIIE